MIKIFICGICVIMAITIWHVSDTSSMNMAWLMLLAWATGTLTGLLIVLDWIIDGQPVLEESTTENKKAAD